MSDGYIEVVHYAYKTGGGRLGFVSRSEECDEAFREIAGRPVRIVKYGEDRWALEGVTPGSDIDDSDLTGDRMLQFFRFSHLPPRLQEVSRSFARLALMAAKMLPGNPERTVALRKLLEAKDCSVRAVLYEEQP